MKKRILTAFSVLLLLVGAAGVLRNGYYLISERGKEFGGVFSGLFDLQLGGKLHLLLFAKALVLIAAYAAAWRWGAQLIKRQREARWIWFAFIGFGLTFAVGGLILALMHEQADFVYRNSSSIWFLRVFGGLLFGAVLARFALGLLVEDTRFWWWTVGLLTVLICNNIANILLTILAPVLHWGPGFFLRNSALGLLFESVSLILLVWLRSEVDETSRGPEEDSGSGSILRLR